MDVVKSNTDLQKQTLEMQQQMLDVCKNSNTTNNMNAAKKMVEDLVLQYILVKNIIETTGSLLM